MGFVTGRKALDATRRTLNLIHYTKTTGEPSLLLTLDAEKAIDKIHLGYLSQVLHKFGLSGDIQAAIFALYTELSAFVFSEGLFS